MKQCSDADRRSPEGERRSPSEDEADEKLSSAEIHNAEDYKEIFQPKNAICRRSGGITPELQIQVLLSDIYSETRNINESVLFSCSSHSSQDI